MRIWQNSLWQREPLGINQARVQGKPGTGIPCLNSLTCDKGHSHTFQEFTDIKLCKKLVNVSKIVFRPTNTTINLMQFKLTTNLNTFYKVKLKGFCVNVVQCLFHVKLFFVTNKLIAEMLYAE